MHSDDGFGRRPATATSPSDDAGNYTRGFADRQVSDPIRELIVRLEMAAERCGAVPLRDGRTVQIARVAGGYAVGRRP
jgi:hypothetical protein